MTTGIKCFQWRCFAVICIALFMFVNIGKVKAQTTLTAGFRDHDFGSSPGDAPTGEKPQSKLWYIGNIWFGSLWDVSDASYTIHQFDFSTQSWTNTGVALDPRAGSRADVLWDGSKLYVASQIFTTSAETGDDARLYRYSYNSADTSYSLDSGFPTTINQIESETLVLDKDSTGKLWVTWTEGGDVWINCSTDDGATWGTPFVLPVQGSSVNADDISSIAAFGGDKIGVLWSNQDDEITYFAVHEDGDAAMTWQAREEALEDSNLGAVADDHINLKMACDTQGNVYAVTKTGLDGSSEPLIYLLKRAANGTWSRHVFGDKSDKHTRPIILLDTENDELYVFATRTGSDRGIYYKKTDLNSISFSSGLGTQFIYSSTDVRISNPTSTKQCLHGVSDLVVMGGELDVHFYCHNTIDLAGSLPASIAVTSPNGGEDWQVGSSQTVTWTSTGTSGDVEIEYSTDNGSNWTTVIASTTDDGTYDWTIPNTPTVNALVRITDTDSSPTDESDAVFTISPIPVIAVTSPNGGEDWQVGSSQTVTWTSTGTSGNVEIEYSTDNGSNWIPVIASTPDDGTYDVTIPNTPTVNALVRITDTDSSPTDQSDAVFTISPIPVIAVTSPNGGEDWQVGSSQAVTWTSTGTSGNVEIEYSTDNGSNWTPVIASTPDDGTYDWTIPNTPTVNALVRISDTDSSPTDQSDAVFTISPIPAIAVTSPNGGEDWQVGSSQAVTWTSTGTSGNVEIEYSTDNGSNWTTVIASTSDDGTYDWTIPNTPTVNALVRITDTDSSPTDQSDGVFTLSEISGLAFRVERSTGDVFAGGSFIGGGADLAERIKVSESVEFGDVVELDPDNPEHYRKTRGSSELIAGIITTEPGFTLGNNLKKIAAAHSLPMLSQRPP